MNNFNTVLDFETSIINSIDEHKWKVINRGMSDAFDIYVDLLVEKQGYTADAAADLVKSLMEELETSEWDLVNGMANAMQEVIKRNALSFLESKMNR